MKHIDISNKSIAAQEAEINRFVIRTTDLKDPVVMVDQRFNSLNMNLVCPHHSSATVGTSKLMHIGTPEQQV